MALEVDLDRTLAGPGKMVPALVSGLRVLNYLVRAEVPVGVSQVARDLSLSPSTCFNLLKTLVHERLAIFDPVKKTYSVGFGLLEITKGVLERDNFVKLMRPRLERIAAAHRVTVTSWRRLSVDRAVLVDRADAAAAVRVHMTIGQRLPIFVGAFGRCFAAFGDVQREELRRRFDQLRWEVPPDFEEYWSDVRAASKVGHAIDRDHFVKGITSVAAPVRSENGPLLMAISAIGFSGQFAESSLSALARDLVEEASAIGAAMFPGVMQAA